MCQPTDPCYHTHVPATPAPTSPTGNVDSGQIIYHLTPGQVSKLTCVRLGNGVTLTQILEAFDKEICARGVPSPLSLNLGCLVTAPTQAPATFAAVIDLIATKFCELKTATSVSNLITALLASNTFLTGLADSTLFISRLLLNNNFLTGLAGNTIFTTALTNNSSFVTQLAGNQEFVTKLGTTLLSNTQFIAGLVQRITEDAALKAQFCCATEAVSPCAGMIINGVTLTDCSCIPPTNLRVSGPLTIAPNTNATYTIGYSGTEGLVTWAVAGGLLGAHDSHSATIQMSASGSITATLTGCDGHSYTATQTIIVGAACVSVTGLAINGNAAADANTTATYTASVSKGTVLGYKWTVTGGTINGSSTSSSVTVNWTSAGGTLTVSVTDCTTVPKVISKQFTATCLPVVINNISGPTQVLAGSNQTYSALLSNNRDVTYTWSVIYGTIISGEQGDNVTVQWDNTGTIGGVTVTARGCNNGFDTQTLNVQVTPASAPGPTVGSTPPAPEGPPNATIAGSNFNGTPFVTNTPPTNLTA